jgi:hypothetical protein
MNSLGLLVQEWRKRCSGITFRLMS